MSLDALILAFGIAMAFAGMLTAGLAFCAGCNSIGGFFFVVGMVGILVVIVSPFFFTPDSAECFAQAATAPACYWVNNSNASVLICPR